jgi:hypothetical protein
MASNPSPVACTADAWTKVVNNKTNATIHKYSTAPNPYYHTYRVTGDPAPSGAPATADAIEWKGDAIVVNFDTAVDVYLYANGAAGSVRVDA